MSDLNKTDPSSRPSGRGLRIALAISLALNLLIVGAIAGAALSGRGGGERSKGERISSSAEMSAVGLYGRALSREDRREIGRALTRSAPGKGRALRRELRALAGEAVALLNADPFDAARFGEILTRQQGLIKDRSDEARAVLLAHISAMSLEERRAYASGLERAMVRRPGGRQPDGN
ncbi:putative membrane protein [Litoreibacter ponti]|uniref:Putative membrane protein n=1 Tax=Litoreibacter ponti TaxID=1510457 RepID=A0A2T6BLF0_9RHOB|nr:periplasmic heavy metal sensor [Litoreibacter ponti]PTX56879.1 putative membrane protein [Litoreibacter ponti]